MYPPPSFDAPNISGSWRKKHSNNQSQSNNTYVESSSSRSRHRSGKNNGTPNKNGRLPKFSNQRDQRDQRCPSPSASYASNGTTYAQPWNSTVFESPRSPRRSEHGRYESGRYESGKYESGKDKKAPFRRSASLSEKKSKAQANEHNGESSSSKSDRPRINFSEIGKKIMKPFKKNDSRKNKSATVPESPITPCPSTTPNIETKDTCGPSIPSSNFNRDGVRRTVNLGNLQQMSKMQQEDKMKLYQKVGMKQSMKMTTVQRMQRERQRDFQLVPGPVKCSIEDRKRPSQHTVTKDGLIIFASPAKKPCDNTIPSLLDVNVGVGNTSEKITNKPGGSSCVGGIQNLTQKKTATGPALTSTPKSYSNVPMQNPSSPDISNVGSSSISSLCINVEDDTNSRINETNTLYFSSLASSVDNINSDTRSITGSNHIEPSAAQSSNIIAIRDNTPTPFVKQELQDNTYDNHSSQTSSHCPSIASTSTSNTPFEQDQFPEMPMALLPPNFGIGKPNQDQLSTLWNISQRLHEQHMYITHTVPLLQNLHARLAEIYEEKSSLLRGPDDQPGSDQMKRMWDLNKEEEALKIQSFEFERNINLARNEVNELEMRKTGLLNFST